MATAASLLTAVETAIESLLTGKLQSYEIEGRTYTFLDLAELRVMRKQLLREVALLARRKTGGGMFSRARWGSS